MKKKHVKILLILLGIVPGFVLLYLAAALFLSAFSVNRSFRQPENGIDIYVKSNGVHTDILAPVSTPEIDWKTKVNTGDFKPSMKEFQYVSFGWGDKGFYLYTPTWDDLKYSTAFKA